MDSEPLANRLFTEALQRLGLPVSYEEVCRDFTGLTLARCMEIAEQRLGRPLPESFPADLQGETFELFRRELRPVPGIEEALDRLRVPCCVASSGEMEKMRLTLGLTGLLSRFEGRLFSATEVARGKPAPDLFLYAAASLSTEAARCTVVEDSLPGVLAGRAAGMRVLAYAAAADAGALRRAGAVTFNEMRELPDLIAAPARG